MSGPVRPWPKDCLAERRGCETAARAKGKCVKTCLSRFKGVETTMARAREASDTVVVPSRPLSAPAQSGPSGKKRRRAPIQMQARCQCIESKMSQKLHKDLKSRGVGIESEEAEKENDAVDGMEDWMRGLMEVHPVLKMLPENIRCRLARLAMNKLRQRDGISVHWLDRMKAFHFKNDSTEAKRLWTALVEINIGCRGRRDVVEDHLI